MSRKTLILTIFLGAIILIATVQGMRPTFKDDPAVCAWYNDTSIPNGLVDYAWNIPTSPDWRGTEVYDQINVFARSNDDRLWWYHFTPYNHGSAGTISLVSATTSGLPYNFGSSPAVVQRGPNTIDVFVMGSVGNYPSIFLYQWRWDGRSWLKMQERPMDFAGVIGLAASSWGPNRIDLFVVEELSGEVWHESLTLDERGYQSREWESLGRPPGGANSAPAAASWEPYHIDVVVRGQGNAYYRKSYNPDGWGEWQPQPIPGGVFSSSPCITAAPMFPGGGGGHRINIFGRGTDMKIYGIAFDSNGVSSGPWGDFGGRLNSAPAAINYVGDHFTVFAKGMDNTLWYLDWDNGRYDDPEDYVWAHPDLEFEETRGAPEHIVAEEQPSIMQMMKDTNIPGSDYKDFDLKVADPKLCAQACIDDPVCVACTYVNPGYKGANARCWLKNNVASQVRDECCVSGVKNISVVMPQIAPPQPDKVPSAIDKNGHPDGGVSGNNIKFPQLGNRIKVNEYGIYFGEWTRIDGTDTFNAVWNGPITDVIEVQSIEGNQVTLYRQGNGGYYYGTLNGDGTITGTASWYEPNWKWSGTIEKT